MRILAVELQGIVVDGVLSYAESAEDAISILSECERFDILLAGIGAGEMFPYHLRTAKVNTPLIMLGANSDLRTRAKMLERGADGVLPLPIHRDELDANICAVVRRYNNWTTNLLEVGELVLDLTNKRLEVGGTHVHLTVKEYRLLEVLMLRPNRVFHQETFIAKLYDMDEPDCKIVDVYICKLRKKLREVGVEPIKTSWGKGYYLERR